MENCFELDILKEKLNTHLFNTLTKYDGKEKWGRQIVGTDKFVIDLEGESLINIRRLNGFRNIVGISSYYFSNGYMADESGRLKKKYAPKTDDNFETQKFVDNIDENTNFDEFINNKSIVKKLNSLGYTKVKDILGKSYIEFLKTTSDNQKVKYDSNIKLWYEVASRLAGHGYVFSYDYENMGMITKGESRLYPGVDLGKTEIEKKDREDRLNKQREEEQRSMLGCDNCKSVEELERELKKISEENACLKTSLYQQEQEIVRLQRCIVAIDSENKSLCEQVENLKCRNKSLHNDLETISSVVRKYVK